MIRYRLKCEKRHEFEGWFASSSAFDRQAKRGEIACPRCGNAKVQKALMTPGIAKGAKRKPRAQKTSRMTTPMAGPAPSELHRVAAHGDLAAAMPETGAENRG